MCLPLAGGGCTKVVWAVDARAAVWIAGASAAEVVGAARGAVAARGPVAAEWKGAGRG
jgi:hypothetical protein